MLEEWEGNRRIFSENTPNIRHRGFKAKEQDYLPWGGNILSKKRIELPAASRKDEQRWYKGEAQQEREGSHKNNAKPTRPGQSCFSNPVWGDKWQLSQENSCEPRARRPIGGKLRNRCNKKSRDLQKPKLELNRTEKSEASRTEKQKTQIKNKRNKSGRPKPRPWTEDNALSQEDKERKNCKGGLRSGLTGAA